MTARIAMWSGPRSLSTAMMRAWENREDTTVVDEPLYACYLAESGIDHPMRDEVIASQSTDWRDVVAELGAPCDAPVFFQKHMAHHLLPTMGRDWLDEHRCAFLVRNPRAIVSSYAVKRKSVTLADVGITQLSELFDRIADRQATPPPVVVVEDLLQDPRGVLTALCARLEVPFSERMLAWPPGRRASDGIWAPHWYGNVERSTGWVKPNQATGTLSESHEQIVSEALPHHHKLLSARVTGG